MGQQYDVVPRTHRAAVRQGIPKRQLSGTAFPSASSASGDLRKAYAILLKHWRAAAIFAITTIVLVTAATLLMPAIYEAQGRLQIDPPGQEAFSLQTATGEVTDAEYVNTEAQKLQTHELALATVTALHLDQRAATSAPGSTNKDGGALRAALSDFRSHLSIHRDPGSRLVVVQFASRDPGLSAEAVNTLMKLFIDRSYQSRNDAITQSSLWLSKQLDDIRAKMDQSSQELSKFQQEHGIVDSDQGSTSGFQALTELNKQLADATSQRIQLEAFAKHSPNMEALPQFATNQVVQSIKQKLAEANGELAQTRVIYGPNHPNVKKLEGQIAEFDRQLHSQSLAARSELNSSYAAAQNREGALRAEVDKATGQLGTMEQYTSLKKQAEADRQLYASLYAKIKESGIAAASKTSNLRIVEEAPVLDRPTRPHRLLNLLLGVVFGLIGGVVVAFIKEGLEDRIHTTEDMRHWTGLSSVIVVPEVERPAKLHPEKALSLVPPFNTLDSRACLLLNKPNSPELEAINALRTLILLAHPKANHRVFLVTSPLPGDGKTTMATNLALSLSKLGRTCLIDADLRRPRVGKAFQLIPGPGLADLLRGTATLEEVLQPVQSIERLAVISSWTPSSDAAELVSADAMTNLLAQLRSMFDYVVLDTPPVLPYAESRDLSAMVDGIILVGRAAVTPRAAMRRTTELLNEINSAPVLSIVLNGADLGSDFSYLYSAY